MKKLSLPKGQKHYYFILTFGIILTIIIIAIAIISLKTAVQPTVTITTTTPTLSPTPLEQQIIQTTTPLKWNQNASKITLQREEQRIPLSTSDEQAKTRILQLLPNGQNYGVVYSSPNVTIQYDQALDLFEAETLNINVAAAKKEAENWLKQEGMSQQGLCDLPLDFYPGGTSEYLLQQSKFIYDELPDGC
jgi:hypothetical protein